MPAVRSGAPVARHAAAEDELTHGGLGVVVEPCGRREGVRVAAAERAGSEAHRGRHQIHRLKQDADMLEHEGVGHRLVLPRHAAEAGRDPASVPITIWGVKENLDLLKRDRDDGVSRLVVSLDSARADTILPELDRWATLIRQLGS